MIIDFLKKIFRWWIDIIFWIQPDISKLKNNINNNKVIVQYTPPKWLSPSEIWMIYYRKYKASNINCLIYKWASEWKISLKKEWYNKTNLIFLKNIDNNVPKYELLYWQWLWNFKMEYGDDLLLGLGKLPYYYKHSTKDPKGIRDLYIIQNELLNYCINKWRIKRSWKEKYTFERIIFMVLIPTAMFFSGLFPIIYLWAIFHFNIYNIFPLNLDFIIVIWFALVIFTWRLLGTKMDEFMCPKDLELTKKWKKLFAEIYWYKYFLEHCDEEKLKKLTKDNPDFIDETMPYAVALRLNLSFLKNSMTNFSVTNINVDKASFDNLSKD